MDRIGATLSSMGTLIVAIGMLVVLLRAGGLIEALSRALGGRPKAGADQQ
ncbi:MAG: hypothetical protein GWP05_00300 [Anaerolineaceae bacterium]|nr:hypothetical protein [Anaerolineaceae bacterium]